MTQTEEEKLGAEISNIIRRYFMLKTPSSIAVDILALIKQAGWKSPEEIALMFNPDYLDFQKGVTEGRKLERVKMLANGYKSPEEVTKLLAHARKLVKEYRFADNLEKPL